MMLGAAANGPAWVYPLTALGSTLLTVLLVYVGFYPQLKDHRLKREERVAREQRIDACNDAVLGRPADWSRGQSARVGLSEIVARQGEQLDDLIRAIGPPNGKTIMEHIVEAKQSVVEAKQSIDAHVVQDAREFASIRRSLKGDAP